MTEKERNELDKILMNDPLLACDVIDEKSNYQYTVKILKWTWGGRYSVCINDKIGHALVDSPLMDEDELIKEVIDKHQLQPSVAA